MKKEESREKREEKREKRRNGCKLDSLHLYSVLEGRDGGEKGRRVRGEREGSREGSAAGGVCTMRRESKGMKEASYNKKRESRKGIVRS